MLASDFPTSTTRGPPLSRHTNCRGILSTAPGASSQPASSVRMNLAHEVIQSPEDRGLPLSELTIPKALKPLGYATALIGKWHLGHRGQYWPPNVHGFDVFKGLPYSHDMKPLSLYTAGPGVELTQEDVDFPRLTQRFFDRGMQFIEDNKARPFFLMLSLTAPHLALNPHPDHAGHSRAAAYGDVVEEIDSQVGRLTARLKALGIDRDTLVFVTSDNGPWMEGSSGPLRAVDRGRIRPRRSG
eukprot:gene14707-19463_t